MDCEEELGSPNLPAAVEKYRGKLAADMLVILDGPRHISNLPTLTFGARGIATMRLTTYGPRVPQLSGHYGNYAPNPALRLAQLLASMKDEDGRVIIEGFYDGIMLDETTRQILAQVPDDEAVIQQNLGIAEPDKVAPTYQEALQYPSLNIRGMASAWVGSKVRTIIPDAAVANLDIRTVKESDPQRLVDLVISHIRKQGYHICDQEPNEQERAQYPKLISLGHEISYGAFRTDFDEEVSIWLDLALTRMFGQSPIKIRTSGGSIPIAPFVQTLGIPAVTVPIVNRDNNQHSPNENIRIGNYLEGIYTYLAFLTHPLP
jgi:acetylornithine deacetylase/succinyl-diaminopimelate desuccinylase-like protein